MFVEKKGCHSGNSNQTQRPQVKRKRQRQKTRNHGDVQCSRDQQSLRQTDSAGNAEEPFIGIELEILAGIDDVEAGGPESYGRGEPEDRGV